jgi:hypothetical protein
MTQSYKFRDPNIKNPNFGTYMTQLYKFSDRHWVLLFYSKYQMPNYSYELFSS